MTRPRKSGITLRADLPQCDFPAIGARDSDRFAAKYLR
jgi:hypothetical protein